jgi:SPX domain protein involved in polyphosphate accumulation
MTNALQGDYAGDAELVNSVYLDNSSLEMYHARLDQRPNSSVIRISWIGPQEPSEVYIERQTHNDSWKGEEDVEDRLSLPEDHVVGFLEGQLTPDMAAEIWRTKVRHGLPQPVWFNLPLSWFVYLQGEDEQAIERSVQLFNDIQTAIDAKQLKPMVRTQYMRTSFQVRVGCRRGWAVPKSNAWSGS